MNKAMRKKIKGAKKMLEIRKNILNTRKIRHPRSMDNNLPIHSHRRTNSSRTENTGIPEPPSP